MESCRGREKMGLVGKAHLRRIKLHDRVDDTLREGSYTGRGPPRDIRWLEVRRGPRDFLPRVLRLLVPEIVGGILYSIFINLYFI